LDRTVSDRAKIYKISKINPIYQVSKYSIPNFLAKPVASDLETAPFVLVYKSTLFPIKILTGISHFSVSYIQLSILSNV